MQFLWLGVAVLALTLICLSNEVSPALPLALWVGFLIYTIGWCMGAKREGRKTDYLLNHGRKDVKHDSDGHLCDKDGKPL
jgi:hypothetical protein